MVSGWWLLVALWVGACIGFLVATALTVGVMAVAIALPLGLALVLGNLERFSGSVSESYEVRLLKSSSPG